MMKVFLWGESGFVASLLKKHFYDDDVDIKLIGRSNSCDYTIDILYDTFIPKDIDSNSVVFFLTAISSPDLCNDSSSVARKVNLINTKEIIQKILDSGAIVIFFSSDLVYGDIKEECNESTLPQPNSNYSSWKLYIEDYFKKNENFKTLRLSYLCDINDKFTSFLINSDKKREIDVFNPFYRSMIHSDDFVKVINLYINNSAEVPNIINVCGQSCISRIEYIKPFSKFISLKWKSVEMPKDMKKNRPERINMRSLYINNLITYSWQNPGEGILEQLKKC